ncbi:MAG TPA: c-type cytochrome [Burkholderiaceae bacterium]|nr:c-type cytochrome [Burkholderiaceae bacterium]
MKHALLPVAATAAALFLGFVTAAEAQSAPDKVARGRYLVNTSGCHDCHTPFKLGPKGPEPDMSRALSGHPQELKMPPAPKLPEGPWLVVSSATNTAHAGPWGVSFTANLTPDKDTGLGDWTAQDFKNTIRTGRHLGRGREILPPMPIPVYSQMNDDDLEAIFAYLKTVPAIRNKVPEPLAPAAAK